MTDVGSNEIGPVRRNTRFGGLGGGSFLWLTREPTIPTWGLFGRDRRTDRRWNGIIAAN